MTTAAAFLLVCWWAALSHASVVRTPTVERSSATVHLAGARSSFEPLELWVEAFNQQHNVRLQPASSPLSVDFRLQRMSTDDQGRDIIEDVVEEAEDGDLYEDPATGSVVMVDGSRRVEGVITPTLSLRAAPDGTHEAVRQHPAAVVAEALIDDYLEVPHNVTRSGKSSRDGRGVVSVSPEVYVIVDSKLSAALGSNKKIKKYLSIFWNAVNQRFATMTDPKVNLVISGALMIRNSAKEPFITDNVLSQDYIDGTNTLSAVSDWLFEKRNKLPAYDIAYLMTGKDMADVESGVVRDGLAGIAWKGAACVVAMGNKRSFNTAMGEDKGAYYQGVMIAAHEVAHNLGSPHDGNDGAESCSWDDGYIMSYVSGKANKLFFSSCSQKLMKEYILTSSADCLHKTAVGAKIGLSSRLPGQIFSMDEQCQKITGESQAFASKSVSDDSLCVKLVCQWKEKVGNSVWTYTSSSQRPAAEGSPCRGGGACTNGSCK
ncbi:A disintegrin and metalloproteinase with thrombospondin motifs like [Panulirus ornatus]|uniref:A disintegrin and metalloproteinase with thrombospondin motifs like n=1 Tax=Panulirus ornatus TaxID=150431 RepID=UPI003A85E9D4